MVKFRSSNDRKQRCEFLYKFTRYALKGSQHALMRWQRKETRVFGNKYVSKLKLFIPQFRHRSTPSAWLACLRPFVSWDCPGTVPMTCLFFPLAPWLEEYYSRREMKKVWGPSIIIRQTGQMKQAELLAQLSICPKRLGESTEFIFGWDRVMPSIIKEREGKGREALLCRTLFHAFCALHCIPPRPLLPLSLLS